MHRIARIWDRIESHKAAAGLWLICLWGAAVGLFHATAQASVESTQVIARVVAWPKLTYDMICGAESWCLLNQVPAALLTWQIPWLTESFLSLAISAIAALLIVSGLYALIYVLTQRVSVSLLGPALLLVTGLHRWGLTYPVEIINYAHSNGTVGLGLVFWIMALLASERKRWGLFLFGLLACVHISWFVLLFPVFLLFAIDALFVDRRPPRPLLLALGAGLALSALSYAAHWASTRSLMSQAPTFSMAQYQLIFRSFAQYWDGHRAPVPLRATGFSLSLLLLACLAAFGLLLRHGGLSRSAGRLWGFLLVSIVMALSLALFSHLPFHLQPTPLLFLMPGRVMGIPIMLFVPLALALLALAEARFGDREFPVFPLLAGTFLLLQTRSLPPNPWQVPSIGLYFLAALLAIGFLALLAKGWEPPRRRRLHRWAWAVLLSIALAVPVYQGILKVRSGTVTIELQNFRNDPFWRAIHSDPGPILAGPGCYFLQSKTGRPIVINGWNAIIYLPRYASAAAEAVHDLYGVDFSKKPIGDEYNQGSTRHFETFSHRSIEQWQDLSARYGFSNVIARPNFRLNLPPVFSNAYYVYYRIPSTP